MVCITKRSNDVTSVLLTVINIKIGIIKVHLGLILIKSRFFIITLLVLLYLFNVCFSELYVCIFQESFIKFLKIIFIQIIYL